MQFQKHNFHHNFLNAVETDKPVAWDILVNEVNEIILDHPTAVKAALTSSGIKINPKASAKELLDVVHEGIYENEVLRNKILRLIGKRHADPHINADGGEFDQVIGMDEKTDFNMAGDAASGDEETLNFIFSGAKNLISNVKDKLQAAQQRANTKNKASASLAAKEKQRNLPVSTSKGKMSTGKIIAVSMAAAAAIGLISFLIYNANKNKQAA